MINLISVNFNKIHNMIAVVAMISALKCNMFFYSFQCKGTWFSRRASVASEKKNLANVQGKIVTYLLPICKRQQ